MKKIALYAAKDKPEAVYWAYFSAKKLHELNCEVYAPPSLAELFSSDVKDFIKISKIKEFEKFVDAVLSFGGDGTMLGIARRLLTSNLPIMGVNVGKLGFLAEFETKDLDYSLKGLSENNYRIVDRCILETSIDNETIFAFNDFVIEKKNSSRMITISAFSNEHFIGDYRADGLIITTPSGSTAYSLSSGGPIIAPSTQVVCITPISPHSLNFRPLVVPDSNEIRLILNSPTGEANIVADGQIERTLSNNEEIIIKQSVNRIKLIKPLENSYYDLLRKKLLWATNTINPNK
ncbi:MAG: kinase [Ignavibacteria bacterium]|nr:kinase [Ignavibacteria bacterium]